MSNSNPSRPDSMPQDHSRPLPMPEETFREFLREEISKLRLLADELNDPMLCTQLEKDEEELIEEGIREHRELPNGSDEEVQHPGHFIIDPTHPLYAYQFRERDQTGFR